jgi:hypothetical protein
VATGISNRVDRRRSEAQPGYNGISQRQDESCNAYRVAERTQWESWTAQKPKSGKSVNGLSMRKKTLQNFMN